MSEKLGGVRQHPFVAFSEALNDALWRKDALDAIESHSLIGAPGQDRYCCRCTYQLRPDWKNPSLPVPPKCGDPTIRWKAEPS